MNAVRSDSVDFFLGTTTPAGFKGYFEPLRQEPGMQMYLIKSGPGCGKSTLMKRLAVKAEQKGEPIQRIHCASDPDSLDGVIFLDKRAAIVDATAPHVMEPDAPGAEEQVVSLYHTLDADALHAHADEVKRLFAQNTALRSRAARYIASAGSLLLDSRRAEACSANFEKVRRYVKRLCARTLPRLPEGASASEELRLLSAITPKGPVFYRGTVQALADRYVVFHDDYGAVSRLLLELIRAEALARGYHIITCPCAMHPDDKIDHLFIPALRLAFLTDNRWHPVQLPGVIFLDKRAAIVDATAPHVMEPDAPGAEEQVVSLYHTLDADALHAHADEVKRLFAQNTALRSRAARYIASAGSLLLDSRRAEACSANFEKVRRYVKRLCARTLPRLPEGASASEELRLLSAITPKGPVFYRGTVQALADRYVVFHDDYGAVSRLLLELIRAEALARGYHIITCPCAMHPDDKIDHLFIPALRLAFLTDNRWHPVQLPGVQAVRCTRFVDRENLAGYRARLRFNERAAAELLEQAADLMAQAKACHDELETYYRAAVDFGKVDEAAAQCAGMLGLA